jgi:hypothetical protein
MNFATNLPISERSSESVRQKFYEIICNLITSTADAWSQNVVEKNFQLVGIFLINFEHYKKYVVQVSYPEKSRIGRLNKTNFLQKYFLA